MTPNNELTAEEQKMFREILDSLYPNPKQWKEMSTAMTWIELLWPLLKKEVTKRISLEHNGYNHKVVAQEVDKFLTQSLDKLKTKADKP